MTKRIILTTMSTLPYDPKKNFYKTEDQKYCEGISQLEAGTKYYLSTVKNIEEIVAIGSNEVIDPSKDFLEKVSLKDQSIVQEIDNQNKKSAYSLYRYGIHCFLNEKEAPSTIQMGENRIDKNRQKRIDKIIDENQADSLDERLRKINIAIKEDIEKTYLSEEDKEAYLLEKVPNFNIEEKIDSYIESIKKKQSLSLFEKEIIFVLLLDEIQHEVLNITSKKREFINTNLVKKYQEDLQKLTIELEDMRNHRLATEKQYVKEKIFEKLDSNSKLKCREENKQVKIQFVPLKKENEIDNIQGLLHSIQKDKEAIEIYLDMQGGSRTDGYIRSAVLSLLNNDESSNVKLKKVIACDFERGKFFNPIKDETKRYKITDLVSGMNAFLNYGKAEQLNQTWRELTEDGQHDEVQDIIDLMRKVDQSLSLCDVNSLVENISKLYKRLNKKIKVTNSNEEFMEVLRNNILDDYKGIVERGEIDIFALVKWASKKGFIQQAITLIESRMPEQMVKDGYFTYCSTEADKEKASLVVEEAMKSGAMQKYKLDDINHAMVQEAAYTYKSNFENPANRIFLRSDCLKTYRNNDDVLKTYAKIWSKRNNTNHAGNKSVDYNDIHALIEEFISCYENMRLLIHENGDGLKCIQLPKNEIKRLKDIRRDFNFKREKKFVDEQENSELNQINKSNPLKNEKESCKYDYCLFIHDHETPYTGMIKTKKGFKQQTNPQVKKLYNHFMEKVNDLLNLEEKSNNCEHFYFDSKKEYLNEIKSKSKEVKEKNLNAVFVVPKVIYDENSDLFTIEIKNRKHVLYIVDTKSNPMKLSNN